jgi:hypothetical protein
MFLGRFVEKEGGLSIYNTCTSRPPKNKGIRVIKNFELLLKIQDQN